MFPPYQSASGKLIMVLQEDVMARKIEHCYQFCKSEQGLSLVIITKIFFARKKELNEKSKNTNQFPIF